MAEPRVGGAAVLLDDGSVLLVGGDTGEPTCSQLDEEGTEMCECGEDRTGTASVVRFVPEP